MHARLAPVRAVGDWPGLTDHPFQGHTDGVAVTVTLGQLRVSQALRFLRASALAEAQALQVPGFLWGTALARYAHQSGAGHADAITGHQRRPFRDRSAFLRLQPSQVTGHLVGPNPLPAGCIPPD